MKKIFYIISIIILLAVFSTIAIPLIIISRSYQENFDYYTFLTFLIYLTMVIPLYLLIIIAIKEAKKIGPKLPSHINTGIFVFLALGVLIFQLTINFIGKKDFSTYQIMMWISIIIDLGISILLTYYLSKNDDDKNSGPKFIKK